MSQQSQSSITITYEYVSKRVTEESFLELRGFLFSPL